jgi:Cu(I)/Ag(I) efflux system membrane fusion protein
MDKQQTPQISPPRSPAASHSSQSGWRAFWFGLRMVMVRLRIVLLLVVPVLVLIYWETLRNYWDHWTRPDVASAAAEEGVEYYCPMKCFVTSVNPNPGQDFICPVCSMPMKKHVKSKKEQQTPQGVRARVQLSPEQIQFAGVRTAEVSIRPLVLDVRTVGYVSYDESRLSRIVTRFNGYVEKLHVNKSFVEVNERQPLAEVYSPQVYTAAGELLIARGTGDKDLMQINREKLRLLGIAEDEIRAIENKKGDPDRRVVIRSPRKGRVIRKDIVEGDRIEAGKILFEVADLSAVWVEADVYERDLRAIRVGQEVHAMVEAIPDKKFSGKVALIYPELNTATRTNRVRFELQNELQNSEWLLRSGMFASVTLQTPLQQTEPFQTRLAQRPEHYVAREQTVSEEGVLAVPERAVIDTGDERVVYVETAPGQFDRAKVEVGPRSGGYYPVISGLLRGDRIVADGAFLIDAETRLQPGAALQYYGATGGGHSEHGAGSPQAATSKPSRHTPSEEELKNINQLEPPDRQLALLQQICPVGKEPLGSMGKPIKTIIEGETVFLCCKGCERTAQQRAKEIVRTVRELRRAGK